MNSPMTLSEATEINARMFSADRAFFASRQELEDANEDAAICRAELEAEGGWLRHAESAGWAEIAYLEQYAPHAI